jgi:hypothetical protein
MGGKDKRVEGGQVVELIDRFLASENGEMPEPRRMTEEAASWAEIL